MADLYLEKMLLKGHQTLGFIHNDRGHRHMHLVINRVSKKRNVLFDDSFVGKRSSKAADEIAIEMKLKRAKVIGIQNRKEKDATTNKAKPEKTVGSKQKFRADLERIMAQGHQDITSYLKAVEEDGYKVSIYLDKETGKPRGYGVGRDGAFMDASEIDRKLTISKLSFGGNKEVLEKAKRPEHNIIEQQKQGRRR